MDRAAVNGHLTAGFLRTEMDRLRFQGRPRCRARVVANIYSAEFGLRMTDDECS